MRSVPKWVCLAVLCFQVSGCHSWRLEQVAPAQAIAGRPDRVRITEPGGATIVVLDPTVAGDTLRGRSESGDYAIRIPLADVLRLETRQSNAVSSGLVVAGIGLGVLGIAVACAASC